jgi:hypothetical protein
MFTKNSKIDPAMREIQETLYRLTQQVDLLLLQDWENPEMKRWVHHAHFKREHENAHFKREREKCRVDAAKRYAELQKEMQHLLENYPDIRAKKYETSS